jgi:hypothetical protein
MSNVEDAEMGNDIGGELDVLLDPPRLLGAVRLIPSGRATRAGREVLIADATPRPEKRQRILSLGVHHLGPGADRYRLELDAERGVVLAAHAFANDEPFQIIEALAVELDEQIDSGLFRFEAPEGEEIRRAGGRGPTLMHASIPELAAAAPFRLLVPERVPASWSVHCTYSAPSDRPPAPASASIHYRSESGHESLDLVLRASSEEPLGVGSEDWEEVPAGPYRVRMRPRGGEYGAQSQLTFEHDGTSVLMLSQTLSGAQLVGLASLLVPAPASQL